MADQTFSVNCGFFDSVNLDRLYSADQMNRPYKRIISNGVFATPQGTPSTDLQVVSASNGMNIICKAGEGLFGDKWFENPSDITITVPDNTNIAPRRDSVIVQVDNRTSGRVGNIIYRTGTASANPQPPDLDTSDNVTEYRIANIYVAASANTINNDAIVDLRGSSECPWVTSLIYQVDTSTLFNQWQAAYNNYYEQATSDFENFEAQRAEEWEQFFADLTEDLTLSTNMIMLTNVYTSVGSVSNVEIGIPSYNPETDILQVYINGLRATEDVQYTISSDNSSIDLVTPISAGQTVNFVVFKSIITGDISTAVTMIKSLDNKLSDFMSDGGWINFILESGATAFDSTTTPGVRCIGNRVYLRGAVKNVTSNNVTICTLPVEYRPSMDHIYTTCAVSGTGVPAIVTMRITTNGSVRVVASSVSLSSGYMIPIATSFLANAGNSVAMVYVYKGSVSTYADLPEDAQIGDIYMIDTADSEHDIAADDDVMWNGTEWELLSTVISSAEIDTIINTIS